MRDLLSETPASILSHHADAEAVDSFIAWRKKLRKPLTDRAARMIAKTLAAINADGGDATEALDVAQERGWQTIKADWYWRDKNGNQLTNNRNGQDKGASSSLDEARQRAIYAARGEGERGGDWI